MQQYSIPVVPKELLGDYHFAGYEVLESETEIEERRRLINEAMLLGNGEKQKVKMIFETQEGPIMVVTTIWDASDSHIELKGGIDVPICCIREITI